MLPLGPFAPAGGSNWSTLNYYNAEATLTLLVWDFGQTLGRWRSTRASAEAQRESERNSEAQVLLSVRVAYFTARAERDLVVVARETLANRDAHLAQVTRFVMEGARPKIDLAQARADRANAEVQLINAENSHETAKAQLCLAMGLDGPADYDVGSETYPPVEGEGLSTEVLLQQALRHRQDVASLEQQLRAEQLMSNAVRGAYFPAIGFSTGASNSGIPFDSTAWNWNATVTLTWDLFQGGLTRARVQEAEAHLEAVSAQLQGVRQQVGLELTQARLAVRSADASLSATTEALTNARERLRLAEERYRTGAGSVIERGDAQVAVTSAAAQRIHAEYTLASARAQLLRALGH